MTTVKPTEFKASDFSRVIVKKKDSPKDVNVYLNHKFRNAKFQTPFCRTPFGVSSYGDNDKKSYSLNLSFTDCDILNTHDENLNQMNTEECRDGYLEQLRQVREDTLTFVHKNSKKILKKKKSKEILDELMPSLIKQDEDGKYPARIAPKIYDVYGKSGVPNVSLYEFSNDGNDSVRQIKVKTYEELQDMIPRGSYVSILWRPKFWIVSGKCGVSLIVEQILLLKNDSLSSNSSGFGFGFGKLITSSSEQGDENSDSSSENTEEKVAITVQAVDTPQNNHTTEVKEETVVVDDESSDDDDESEDDDSDSDDDDSD